MATLDAGVAQCQSIQFTHSISRLANIHDTLGGKGREIRNRYVHFLARPLLKEAKMIKTQEIGDALNRMYTGHIPTKISTKDYLPFTGQFVPVITKLGQVMRGVLLLGDGVLEEKNKLYWNCTPMNYGPGERQCELADIAYWIG